MFNREQKEARTLKEIDNAVEKLEEAEKQRNERPKDYLCRKHGMEDINWLCLGGVKENEKYQKYDNFFHHNGKRYLIKIEEDKN